MLLGVAHPWQVATHRQAEEFEQRTVPFRVTLGQVIVHRHDVDTASGQGIQVGRQGRRQSLTFPGLHFGDLIAVQDHAAHQLDIKVTHAEHPLGGLTNRREGFRQQLFQLFALFEAGTKFDGLGLQFGIAQCLELRLHGIDLFDYLAQLLQRAVIAATHDPGQ